MLEARLQQASQLKKIVDSLRELVGEANIDCNESGMSLQCMDSGHVALVLLQLKAEGFDEYRCDRNLPLGINFATLGKILKCAGNDDVLSLRANDGGDILNFVFESPKGDRVSEFDMKLMTIDSELMGLPEEEYGVTISMPSAELQRLCRDLSNLGETVEVEATKEGVRFTANGDVGSGSINIKPSQNVDDDDKNSVPTTIVVKDPAKLSLSLKYLKNFTAATCLSPAVTIQIQDDMPFLVEYNIGDLGFLRFYLAPKGDDE